MDKNTRGKSMLILVAVFGCRLGSNWMKMFHVEASLAPSRLHNVTGPRLANCTAVHNYTPILLSKESKLKIILKPIIGLVIGGLGGIIETSFTSSFPINASRLK